MALSLSLCPPLPHPMQTSTPEHSIVTSYGSVSPERTDWTMSTCLEFTASVACGTLRVNSSSAPMRGRL